MAIEKVSQIYINNNGCFTPIRTALNKLNEVIDAIEGQGDDSNLTVTTLKANTSVITDTIAEKTAAAGITVDGLKIKDSKLNPTLGAVTQLTSISTGVTLNTTFGKIITVSSTLAAQTSTGFTLTNSNILANSLILTQVEYAGNGMPIVHIQIQFDGSASIKIHNAHPSAAFNTTLEIGFQIIS